MLQEENGKRRYNMSGIQTCAIPIFVTTIVISRATEPPTAELQSMVDDMRLPTEEPSVG